MVRRRQGFAWQIPFSRGELAVMLRDMRAAGGMEAMPLEVTLADDAAIAETNLAYLDCHGPTNILSFPPFGGFGPGLGTGSPGTGLLLLSLDAVGRETLLYGQDLEEHTLRLLAHGMAHLAGYDHGNEMDTVADTIFAAGRRTWDALRGREHGTDPRIGGQAREQNPSF